MKPGGTQPCNQKGQLERRAGENEERSIKDANEGNDAPHWESFEVGIKSNRSQLHRPKALPIVGAYGLGSGIVG